jgi:hypothetical protein
MMRSVKKRSILTAKKITTEFAFAKIINACVTVNGTRRDRCGTDVNRLNGVTGFVENLNWSARLSAKLNKRMKTGLYMVNKLNGYTGDPITWPSSQKILRQGRGLDIVIHEGTIIPLARTDASSLKSTV